MTNETINPIHHSTLGGATQAAAGVAGGAAKGAAKGWLGTMGVFILGGALIGFLVGTAGIGTLATGAIAGPIIGGLLGGVAGWVPSQLGGGLGAILGGLKGGSNAANRVREEKGAANMLDAQLSAYQAQAQAMQQATTIYAPSAANNNSFPASTMNQAGTRIQADTAQNLGTINGLALQRA